MREGALPCPMREWEKMGMGGGALPCPMREWEKMAWAGAPCHARCGNGEEWACPGMGGMGDGCLAMPDGIVFDGNDGL